MQVTMLGIVRSNVLQLLFKSLVLVWSERMDSLDADTLHKQGSSADSVSWSMPLLACEISHSSLKASFIL